MTMPFNPGAGALCLPSLSGVRVAAIFCALFACRPAIAAETAIARGAYLARITGCVGCHTPRTPTGDVVADKLLSGGDHPIPGGAGHLRIYPPNITPDMATGIGGWQVGDIAKAIRTGMAPGGRRLSSAMPWRSQFQGMDDADATAIATYLKTVPAIRHSVPAPVGADAKGPEGNGTSMR